jgi:NADH dehydrogenase [ubiquinone] 1 alpha subcomplex assembly factor 7
MLAELLRQRIAEHGPISVAEWMQLCLYHPQHGYYRQQQPFGAEGGFITAPELTPLFGEMLAVWVAHTWEQLGQPRQWQLIEAGPGRGVLMQDIWRSLQKIAPAAAQGVQVGLVETSPQLTALQQERLAELPVQWVTDITALPAELPTILVANELLDAFPVQQWAQLASGEYAERAVTWESTADAFAFTTLPNLQHFASEAPIIETHAAQTLWLSELVTHFAAVPLAVLLIDYGAAPAQPFTETDTLQAVRQHQKVSPLAHVGQADLTAQVNFTGVQQALGAPRHCVDSPLPQDGLTKQSLAHMGGVGEIASSQAPRNEGAGRKAGGCWLTTQMQFLTALGLPVRAARVHQALDKAAQQDLEQRLERLLSPHHMGELFKVLGYTNQPELALAGF